MAFGILRAYNVGWLWHYTQAVYQMPCVQSLLRMRKQCSKHVETFDSQ
jgi:hypothetical protein